MRGLFILASVMVWVPILLFKPHVGVLVWSWISHMNPHSMAYNFVRDFPLLDLTALLTLGGLIFSKEPKSLPGHPVLVALALYFVWIIITTVMAVDIPTSIPQMTKMAKIAIFVFAIIIVMQSPVRLKTFVGVMALSIGFITVKGGLFTIATGGAFHVQGAGGMMGDNNQLAMATAMTVPIIAYFVKHPPKPFLKYPLLLATILTVAAAVGTQSRGGFVALLAVLGMAFLKLKSKFKILAVVLPLAAVAYNFVPDSYKNRIESTSEATEDTSFLGRVAMWKYAVNITDDHPITGGGFHINYIKSLTSEYMPAGHRMRAFHSIYFEVLGEHGYVGLFLFLTIMFTGWYSAGETAKRFRPYKDLHWLADMSSAFQISIIGFAVGGLTVNIATFDYYYHILALIVLIRIIGDKIIAERYPQEARFNPFGRTDEIKSAADLHYEEEERKKAVKKNLMGKGWSPHD